MNQAQTLLDIEKFMSSVCRRDYHWEDFAPDYDQWLDDARAIYDEELEYSLMCAELAGDFHLGDSRQLTDKSLLPFDLVS